MEQREAADMNLERIVGSIATERGMQPFALYMQNGKFELGAYAEPDKAQADLNVIQQQRFAQLICERANVSFAQVRMGQYYCTRCNRWVDVTSESWGTDTCLSCLMAHATDSARQAPSPKASAPAPVEPAPVERTGDVTETPLEERRPVPLNGVAEAYTEAAPPAAEAVPEVPVDEAPAPVEQEEAAAEGLSPAALLEKAIVLAVEAHLGQVDKAGMPYILHPLRMMTLQDSYEAMMAAVLHDVVEDTEWTLDGLRAEGFPSDVVAAVEALTRRADETYDAFIERAARHPLARRVKLADLEDNMDVRRLDTLTKHDLQRLQRYQRAWHRLQQGVIRET